MKIFSVVLLIASFLIKPAVAAWDESKSPWSCKGREYDDWTEPDPPRKLENWERLAVDDTPPPQTTSVTSLLGEDLLWFYQHTLSGNTGSVCPHYPSCSRYSLIAIDEYGLAIGVVMTAERLERCHDDANDKGQYEWRDIDGERKIWDPPQLDAWWSGGSK
jgi:putative component of membrane protein insertase Oxa1/YidC/SpoIIIJ protein YidD